MTKAEISKAVRGRRVLGMDLDGWNNLLVASFAIAAAAAVVGGVATWWIIRLTKEESSALQLALSGANVRIEALKTQGDEARAEIVRDQIELEKERGERLKLQSALAPRDLLPQTQATMIADLSKFAGRSITLSSQVGDAEASSIAMLVGGAFEAAKISVKNVIGRVIVSSPQAGIFVSGPDAAFSTAVVAALQKAGLEAVVSTEDTGKPQEGSADATTVFIGTKPINIPK